MSFSAIVRAATLGAAAMYFLDPERGRRRRALVQDKARSTLRRSERFLDAAKRDTRNRLQGLQARAGRLRATDAWPPAMRLAAISGGGALALYGLTRRGITRPVWSAAGLALVARGATNAPLREMAEMARHVGTGEGATPAGARLGAQPHDETDDWTRTAPVGPPAIQPGTAP